MLTAIVLAAGSSRRMGRNKLLLPYRGKPLLTYVVGNILTAKVGPVIVVTGYEAPLIGETLKGLPVKIVHNPRYETGMTGSIQTGITHADGEGYMICLSDMALIAPEEYTLLKKAFDKQHRRDKACIIQPTYDNQVGNPVTFSAFWRQAILEHPDPEGCKDIVRSHPDNIYRLEMNSSSVLQDLDWPEDYDQLTDDM